MTSILIWAGLSSLAFMVFFAMILMSILQKRSGMAMIAVVALFIGLGTGARAVLLSHAEVIPSSPVYSVAQEGLTFYATLLGGPSRPCVVVDHHRARLAPAFEKFECINARVCPEEVMRITQQKHCTWQATAQPALPRPPGREGAVGDFAPEVLGDTVLVSTSEQDGSKRWMYCSKDSSSLVVVVKYR
jgi:hypothetical protein